ncbi:hypothetical protein KSF78_0000027 [Schistosoma japonicum]|nr:hypothetical protein KSF78_0000027 [Schistosoma japonicum]
MFLTLISSLTDQNIDNMKNYTNESMEYLESQNYTEVNRFDQLSPVTFDNVDNTTISATSPLIINTKFSTEHDGEYKNYAKIYSNGTVNVYDSKHPHIGVSIRIFAGIKMNTVIQIINNVKAVCVIHANGNLTIYYEKIPVEIEKKLHETITQPSNDNVDSSRHSDSKYDNVGAKYLDVIEIPSVIVRSGVLIECTVISLRLTRRSCDVCNEGYSPDRKCHLCSVVDQCAHRSDFYPTIRIEYGVSNNSSTATNEGQKPFVHSSEAPTDKSTPVYITTGQAIQQSVGPVHVTKEMLEVVTVTQTPNQSAESASSGSVSSVDMTTEQAAQQSVNSKYLTNEDKELLMDATNPILTLVKSHHNVSAGLSFSTKLITESNSILPHKFLLDEYINEYFATNLMMNVDAEICRFVYSLLFPFLLISLVTSIGIAIFICRKRTHPSM